MLRADCTLTLQQDLYKPDSNRLRRNLSGIINFAKFREEKLVPYTDMQESVEHLLEETAELEELNMRLVRRMFIPTLSVLIRHITSTIHAGPCIACILVLGCAAKTHAFHTTFRMYSIILPLHCLMQLYLFRSVQDETHHRIICCTCQTEPVKLVLCRLLRLASWKPRELLKNR